MLYNAPAAGWRCESLGAHKINSESDSLMLTRAPRLCGRAAASASLKPDGEVFNFSSTAEVSCIAASRTESEAFWFAEFFGLDINQLLRKFRV